MELNRDKAPAYTSEVCTRTSAKSGMLELQSSFTSSTWSSRTVKGEQRSKGNETICNKLSEKNLFTLIPRNVRYNNFQKWTFLTWKLSPLSSLLIS